MENQELYSKFITISQKISNLEYEKKIIQEQVMNKLTEEKLEKVETDNGKITLGSRKKWTYSENVEKKNTELKDLKKVEENTGVAKQEKTSFLRVTLK